MEEPTSTHASSVLLVGQPVILNLGLPEFYQSLVDQQVEVVHIDWRPPAGGDEELIGILDELL
jgi:FdrA protein